MKAKKIIFVKRLISLFYLLPLVCNVVLYLTIDKVFLGSRFDRIVFLCLALAYLWPLYNGLIKVPRKYLKLLDYNNFNAQDPNDSSYVRGLFLALVAAVVIILCYVSSTRLLVDITILQLVFVLVVWLAIHVIVVFLGRTDKLFRAGNFVLDIKELIPELFQRSGDEKVKIGGSPYAKFHRINYFIPKDWSEDKEYVFTIKMGRAFINKLRQDMAKSKALADQQAKEELALTEKIQRLTQDIKERH